MTRARDPHVEVVTRWLEPPWAGVARPWVAPLLWALALVAASTAGAANDAGADFAAYWTAFRRAVQAGDREHVAGLTRFPFETRGDLDDDPVERHDRTSFLALYDALLAQDPGLRPQPDSMRSLVERSAQPPPGAVTGGEARVGVFAFERVGGHWRFVRAYLTR